MVHNDKGTLAIVGAHQIVTQVQVLHWQARLVQHTGTISVEQMPIVIYYTCYCYSHRQCYYYNNNNDISLLLGKLRY